MSPQILRPMWKPICFLSFIAPGAKHPALQFSVLDKRALIQSDKAEFILITHGAQLIFACNGSYGGASNLEELNCPRQHVDHNAPVASARSGGNRRDAAVS